MMDSEVDVLAKKENLLKTLDDLDKDIQALLGRIDEKIGDVKKRL